MDYAHILQHIWQKIQPQLGQHGHVADYIPPLAQVNPKQFGMAIMTVDGKLYTIGEAYTPFSIQSVVKTFALTLAMSRVGDGIWQRVRREPSGNAFNSLVQLEQERGMPRNPFINAGAITITDILCGKFVHPETALLQFIQKLAQDASISYNLAVAQAEFAHAYRNLAIAYLIKSFANLDNDPRHVVQTYCTHCAIAMNCVQLAKAGLFLARQGTLLGGERILSEDDVKRTNAIMLTCGAYNAAGDLAYRIGWPLKTGVGGGILAVLPGVLSAAVWSPNLDETGNSWHGVQALEILSDMTDLSVF